MMTSMLNSLLLLTRLWPDDAEFVVAGAPACADDLKAQRYRPVRKCKEQCA